MRDLAGADRIHRFLRALGRNASSEGACYLTGGATAVLVGWRDSTIDIDLKLDPESDGLLREIQRLKNELEINVELASPADFIPVAGNWRDRSIFVTREGRLSVYHFDPYAQALAKLERGHEQDLVDVRELVARGFVEPAEARAYFDEIEADLYRFPAIDPRAFRRRVEEAFTGPPPPPSTRGAAP
jgi:hypothetical protein